MTHNIIIGDTHINSTVALCKPNLTLDDGGTYNLSPLQWRLWHDWEAFVEFVGGLQGEKNLILNGDTIEADAKKRSHQVITRNKADLIRIAVDTLDGLLQRVTKVYVVRGTPAHTGKSGEIEELFAADIGAVKNGEVSSWWYLNKVVDGVRLDIAHHASMSGIPWSSPNAANQLAARVMGEYAMNGEKPPDVVLRSHVHRWSDSFDNYPVRAITLPAWTYATSYINQLNPGAIAQVGGAVITVENGVYEVKKWKAEKLKRNYTEI